MEKLLEKIDSYNIFTNVIPGFLFLIFNTYYFNFHGLSIGEQIIVAYFVGQTLNRIGSIVTGKILLLFTKEKGETYDKYIKANKNDEMISTLLTERNTFRTLCTLFVICIIEIGLSKVINIYNFSKEIITLLVLILLIVIYAISFCKHNKYVANRIRISSKIKKNK